MKREIKFRAKTYFGKWMYGYVYEDNYGYFRIKTKEINGSCTIFRDVQVITETIGQFTGLTDKNGKEIYEGDILFVKFLDSEVALVVYFDEKHLCWSTRDKDDNSVKTPLYNLISNNFEMFVIRNIHDL